jgi:hypothetical protein
MTDLVPQDNTNGEDLRPVHPGRPVTDARTAWLAATKAILSEHAFVSGAWLVGSLGRGTADAYSDIDLIVAVDPDTPQQLFDTPFTVLGLPGTVLFTRAKPRNAPDGGAYLAICIDLSGIPVLVDLYVWPSATAAVPTSSRILYARSALPATGLEFMTLLDRHRSADPTGGDPGDPATVLLLLQLAAKYHARGDRVRQDSIHRQLQLPEHAGLAELHGIADRVNLDAWPQFAPAVAATRRLLEHAASVHPPS